MSQIQTLAAQRAKGKLQHFPYDPAPLGDDQVEIAAQYRGVCHSDLTMLNTWWQKHHDGPRWSSPAKNTCSDCHSDNGLSEGSLPLGLGNSHSAGYRTGQSPSAALRRDHGVQPFSAVRHPSHGPGGIIGIGGLGHMALQLDNKWGCDVTAFTSSASKAGFFDRSFDGAAFGERNA